MQILASREAMLKKLKELLAEQVELRRKNKLLESWIIAHMRKVRCLIVNFIFNLISILHC